MTGLRIGSGFDAHALVDGRPLILGGVQIPHPKGLAGDSDADCLFHAVADALLGAIGAGDLGEHFPPGDPRCKGISSGLILERVREILAERNYSVVNIDATVIAQRPRLRPHVGGMRQNLATHLQIASEQVSIKSKSTDHLGFTGREEGIAALVTALVSKVV